MLMRRTLLVLGSSALLVGVLSFPAGAGDVAHYEVSLDGASEVPGPGDPDGSADVTLDLGTVSNEVCVNELTISGVDTPTLFHIHRGAVGVAGPVVVDLVPALTAVPYCATVDAALMAELITTPEAFYLNIHNEAFPAGAVRGQLPSQTPPTSDTTSTIAPTTTAAAGAGTATRPSFTG
jgi:hypothetical protein